MESNSDFKKMWLWVFPFLLALIIVIWTNQIIPILAMVLIILSLLIACLMVPVTFAMIESKSDFKSKWYGLFALSSIGVTLVNVQYLIITLTYREYHIGYLPAFITWFILIVSAWLYSKRGLQNQRNTH